MAVYVRPPAPDLPGAGKSEGVFGSDNQVVDKVGREGEDLLGFAGTTQPPFGLTDQPF